MPDKTKHQLALDLVRANQLQEAAQLLAAALNESESAELWNDWATVKLALNEALEARVGYERALEVQPENAQAQFNLGVLSLTEGKTKLGIRLLQQCAGRVTAAEQEAVAAVLQQHQQPVGTDESLSILDKFAPPSGAGQEYFATHRDRYRASLELLPQAVPGQTLLELGASFHQLTPAIEAKGYAVRCADVWNGEPVRNAEILSRDGQDCRRYTVDNFDVQQERWPYADGSFDVVLFCEMLEHLSTDPLHVMAEINRVLTKDGLVLLTTPNIASAKSANYILEGKTPYIFGQYVPGGLPTDRHNREYTTGEVVSLLQAAGFQITALETHNSWWKDQNGILAKLVGGGQSIAHRGDNTFALARKTGQVQDRFPEEFYCGKGSQAENRDQITGAKKKNILLVHEVLPHFDRSGSDMRIMQVIRRMRAQGHTVTYIGRSDANSDKYTSALMELGVTCYSGDSDRLPPTAPRTSSTWKLEDVLQNSRFDVAVFFHWFWSGDSITEQYLDDVRKLSPETRIVVLTDDRHGIREWRAAELSKLSFDHERALNFLVREAECYRAADLVLAITEDDRKGLLELLPDLTIELLPMTAETVQSKKGFADRKDFIFLANFDNLANRDAAIWFCDEIWPRILKRLPEARVHIAGNNIPPEFAAHPGVELMGYVPDLGSALERFRVFVSPIRFGTGIKTKNLVAMGHGIPLVTTTIGAEGMSLSHGTNALLCDSAANFAGQAVELYQDQNLWNTLAANGLSHIGSKFSVEHLDHQIKAFLEMASAIEPRSYDPEHRFSVRLVEELYPECLQAKTGMERLQARVSGYVNMAERLLALGKPAEALEHLRHVFSFVRGSMFSSLLAARILSLLERCYRETGDQEAAHRCGQEAKRYLPELNPVLVKSAAGAKGKAQNAKPTLSVIIPTYNRRKTLERCLNALSAQTFPPELFEVIVVDDGSKDDTQKFLERLKVPFRLSHFCEENQGAGAARKLAVEKARGEYLLFINDDTIALPDLLQEHMFAQRQHPSGTFAVLGTFEYERAARRRALTTFLGCDPFMFPQIGMRPDYHYSYSHFITCNLSVRRDAVLAAGSFDPAFRLGEDTELGIRMVANGCKVLYHPQARAIHDHLEMTTEDMVRRAQAYGPTYLRLLNKHPSLKVKQLGIELGAPITTADIEQLRQFLAGRRSQIEEMVRALKQYDGKDFEPAFARRNGNESAADVVVALFRQAMPQLHWFYVFDGLCSAWTDQPGALVAEAVPAGAGA